MSKIKAIIIEDEIPAARLLYSMLKNKRAEWDIEVVPGSIEEAVEWFKVNPQPDLLFLDIQLSDGNSFELLSKIQPQSAIIFTTAYDEYAIRAFSVNSIDYILKPIDEQRLSEAISKYESLKKEIQPADSQSYLETILECLSSRNKKFRTRFLISGVDKLWTLQVDNIAYFYSENRVTFAVTHKAEEHIIDLTLDKLMEQLDPDKFFKANRQTIIGIESIKKIEPYFNNKVVVSVNPPAKEKITISKEKIPLFKLWLNY